MPELVHRRKSLLKLDRASLSASALTAIGQSSDVTSTELADDLYGFTFRTEDLDHAVLLLSQHPDRFGHNLQYYLMSAAAFFSMVQSGFVVMPNGSDDFKKRHSEDLGVAIASLFMVSCLRLRWESICQIPSSAKTITKPTRQRPDFVGFTDEGEKHVYEAKGTTHPESIDEFRTKAKDQLAAHGETGVTKTAIVTFIPLTEKVLPSFVFVSDPSGVPLPSLDMPTCVALHLWFVIEFAGVDSAATPLREFLIALVASRKARASGGEPRLELPGRMRTQLESVRRTVEAVSVETGAGLDGFVGRVLSSPGFGKPVKIFLGVHKQHLLDTIASLHQAFVINSPFWENGNVDLPRFKPDRKVGAEFASTFPDGTVLKYLDLGSPE